MGVKETFTIIHTAKDVEYNIKGFSDKNKDEVSETIIKVLENSKNNFVIHVIKGVLNKDQYLELQDQLLQQKLVNKFTQ